MESLRYLLRDRDGKYGEAFETVFQADDLRVIKSAPQAPRMNAHFERVIGTIRREALDHILITGERRAHQVLKTYEDHHNRTPTDRTASASSAASSTSTDTSLDRQ
jgi:hypothetical protein